MHLIDPLASGVAGAGGGYAKLFQRGTSTRASWYETFEADGLNDTGDDIDLDANGGVVAYVNEYVTVEVYASAANGGGLVRSFVAGSNASAIETITPSFTGTDYETAATGVNKPVDLQEVLRRWFTSAGAPDWNVSLNGVSTTLQQAVSGNIFVNVKVAPFSATGDGVTDDTAAINAAFVFANTLGGATVYFPPGTYLISDTIEITGNCNALGTRDSAIERNSSNFTMLEFMTAGSVNRIQGLQLLDADAGSNEPILTFSNTNTVTLEECIVVEDLAVPDGFESPLASPTCGNLYLVRSFFILEGTTPHIVNRTGGGLLGETVVNGSIFFWVGSDTFADAQLDGVMSVSGSRFFVNCGAGNQPPVLLLPREPSSIVGNRFSTTIVTGTVVVIAADSTAGGGTYNTIIESGNVLASDILRFRSFAGRMLAHSRGMRRREYAGPTGATVTLDPSDAGLHVITTSGGAGVVTVDFGIATLGINASAEVDLFIRNPTGANHTLTTVSTSPVDAGVAINAGQILRVRYIYTTVGATTTWWRQTAFTVTAL